MDPAIVDSATFGLLWKVSFNNEEQVLIPLVSLAGLLSQSAITKSCSSMRNPSPTHPSQVALKFSSWLRV
jgi:hypothetical protein